MTSAFGALSQLAHAQNAPTLTAEAAALEAERAQVQAWIDTVWEECDKPLAFPGIEITYERQIYASMNDAELAAAEKEIEGKPEHPKRATVDWERGLRKTGGYSTSVVRVFLERPDAWRTCNDLGPNFYNGVFDNVSGPTGSWRLSPTHLVIGRSGNAPDLSPEERAITGDANVFIPELREFLTCGICQFRAAGLRKPEVVGRTGEEWSFRVRSGPETKKMLQIDGRLLWNTQSQMCRIVSRRFSRHEVMPEHESSSTEYADWVEDATLNRSLPSSILEKDKRGNVLRSLVWRGSRPSPYSFDNLSRLPDADGVDEIRGGMHFTSVLDYRSGNATKVSAVSRATEESAPIPNYVRTNLNYRRFGGWAAFAFLAVLLCYFRWKSRSNV